MTFVKVKIQLSKIASGDILEVTLNPGEPLENVPRSAKEAGFQVLDVKPAGQHYLVTIQKP